MDFMADMLDNGKRFSIQPKAWRKHLKLPREKGMINFKNDKMCGGKRGKTPFYAQNDVGLPFRYIIGERCHT
jgi:hypothetical protein